MREACGLKNVPKGGKSPKGRGGGISAGNQKVHNSNCGLFDKRGWIFSQMSETFPGWEFPQTENSSRKWCVNFYFSGLSPYLFHVNYTYPYWETYPGKLFLFLLGKVSCSYREMFSIHTWKHLRFPIPTGKNFPFSFLLSTWKLFPLLLGNVSYSSWEKFFLPTGKLLPFQFEKWRKAE